MSSAVKPSVRPTSPHWQIYRMPLTAYLSISHRITGVGLAVGLLVLEWWVTAAALGETRYATVMGFLGSWFGQLCLLGFSFALFFHLCNGVRHLVWDAGKGFELADTERANLIVLGAAVVLTAGAWIAAL